MEKSSLVILPVFVICLAIGLRLGFEHLKKAARGNPLLYWAIFAVFFVRLIWASPITGY